MDFSRAEATLMASNGSATSINFLRVVISVIRLETPTFRYGDESRNSFLGLSGR
jgi:hypothetical protein